MGYTTESHMVRVDVFKAAGKWYESISVSMKEVYTMSSVQEAVKVAIESQTSYRLGTGYIFVCLKPYHQFKHPILLK